MPFDNVDIASITVDASGAVIGVRLVWGRPDGTSETSTHDAPA